jgi:hypothetical protein
MHPDDMRKTSKKLFSFVSEFSRVQYSDQVTADAFGNHLG